MKSREDPGAEFFALSEAYEVLRDPEKRKTYDLTLSRQENVEITGKTSRKRSRFFVLATLVSIMIAVTAVFFKIYLPETGEDQPPKVQESLTQPEPPFAHIEDSSQTGVVQTAAADTIVHEMAGSYAPEQRSQEKAALPADPSGQTAASEKGPDVSERMEGPPPIPAGLQSAQRGSDPAPEPAVQMPPIEDAALKGSEDGGAIDPDHAPQKSFEDMVLSLEDTPAAHDALAIHRLRLAIMSAHNVNDLRRTLPLVKSEQTRNLIHLRLEELGALEQSGKQAAIVPAPEKLEKEARSTEILEVATGPKSNEKIVRLKPGSGLSQSFKDCSQCPEMVLIPSGTLVKELSSLNDDGLRTKSILKRDVIAKPFAISKFKITFENWQACVMAGACSINHGASGALYAKRPVRGISWFDAKEYVNWISGKTGHHYRLLRKAEWDYIARATDGPENLKARQDAFESFGQKKNSPSGGEAANRDLPNSWGVYNTRGPLLEWVEDCLNQGPQKDLTQKDIPTKDLPGSSCELRFLRGGGSLGAAEMYWAEQMAEPPALRDPLIGFRIARDLSPPSRSASRDQPLLGP